MHELQDRSMIDPILVSVGVGLFLHVLVMFLVFPGISGRP